MTSEGFSQSFKPGWSIRSSILMELDIAISALSGGLLAGRTEEYRLLVQSVKPEQIDELRSLLGEGTGGFLSILEPLAWLAGVLFEEDYARATRAVEKMSAASALAELGSDENPKDTSMETLANLYLQMKLEIFRAHGVNLSPESTRRDLHELMISFSFMRGEPRAVDFWRWLDRFYYENYQPWRATRQAVLDAQRQTAISNLGAARGDGAPNLSWLSEKNPLLRIPGLHDAVESGRHICFWIEPFGMPDSWSLFPGLVIASFAPPGELFSGFASYAALLAGRVQALADPTRLVILHLIRNMGMNNTDMADYLKMARPTVSIHTRILREAGLIHTYADGRSARHEIDVQAVKDLFKDLERFIDLP